MPSPRPKIGRKVHGIPNGRRSVLPSVAVRVERIPLDLWKKFRLAAMEDGITAREALLLSMQDYLDERVKNRG